MTTLPAELKSVEPTAAPPPLPSSSTSTSLSSSSPSSSSNTAATSSAMNGSSPIAGGVGGANFKFKVEGWLHKEAALKTWKRRWFCNSPAEPLVLSYYTTNQVKPSNLKGSIDLRLAFAFRALLPSPDKSLKSPESVQTGFQLTLADRIYRLVATGTVEGKYWFRGLSKLLLLVERLHPVTWLDTERPRLLSTSPSTPEFRTKTNLLSGSSSTASSAAATAAYSSGRMARLSRTPPPVTGSPTISPTLVAVAAPTRAAVLNSAARTKSGKSSAHQNNSPAQLVAPLPLAKLSVDSALPLPGEPKSDRQHYHGSGAAAVEANDTQEQQQQQHPHHHHHSSTSGGVSGNNGNVHHNNPGHHHHRSASAGHHHRTVSSSNTSSGAGEVSSPAHQQQHHHHRSSSSSEKHEEHPQSQTHAHHHHHHSSSSSRGDTPTAQQSSAKVKESDVKISPRTEQRLDASAIASPPPYEADSTSSSSDSSSSGSSAAGSASSSEGEDAKIELPMPEHSLLHPSASVPGNLSHQ